MHNDIQIPAFLLKDPPIEPTPGQVMAAATAHAVELGNLTGGGVRHASTADLSLAMLAALRAALNHKGRL